jgi:hypothetical protein
MTGSIALKGKYLAACCLIIFLPAIATQLQAQEAPIQVDQFLNAFHGKPVGPVAPVSTSSPSATPVTSSTAPLQATGQVTGQSAEQSSSVGAQPTLASRPPTDCPAGMAPGPYGCVATAMPPNAHRVSSDGQWQCDEGYLRFGTVCMSMQTPQNAHLTGVGSNWECNTGYRRFSNSCVAISLPPNAHLADTGNGWACDSGYRQVGSWCTPQ